MPSQPRIKSSTNLRNAPQPPMSERQQMALLMQMTSSDNSRSPSSRQKDRNERGETPLHLAAIRGDLELASKLIANHADVNSQDFAGWTPLHEACNHGHYDIALKLVQAGASVNAKGLDKETPLHDAAANCHLKLVKLLVEKGADIYAKNSKGKTPLDVSPEIVRPFLLDPALPLPETSRAQPRRDDKKSTDKKEEMEGNKEDVYEFEAVKEAEAPAPPEPKPDEPVQNPEEPSAQDEGKRSFELSTEEEADEESRRKKRKEDVKDVKTVQRVQGKAKVQNSAANKVVATKSSQEKKSPCSSPKPSTGSENEGDDAKPDLRVPPLKIVIPQGAEQEVTTRNGKNSCQRAHQALPYVVPSGESEKDQSAGSPESAPKEETKKETGSATNTEDQQRGGNHQRVLRSSHRSTTDRGSNNSSPQLQRSHSPSPSASPAAATTQDSSTTKVSESQTQSESEPVSTPAAPTTSSAPVELHPRKRKIKKEAITSIETPEPPAETQIHPHDQPITNCYQLYLNIRKQIANRRRGLIPVQPKPPQGFKDYLMNRCTYVLAGTAHTNPNISYPPNLQPQMKDLFTEQEKERYRLRMQHVIEKEKLVLSVEQEILRVHGRAARALANQSLPFSVCTILKDEEVYNLITPEQEEKDRNARSRYNGRLFLSWLQDVDDKWEKIKEHMLLRHHNEAESLHAVQKMDWEWKLKELSLCDSKSTPTIDEHHVPMVHVSDDFDLLPA